MPDGAKLVVGHFRILRERGLERLDAELACPGVGILVAQGQEPVAGEAGERQRVVGTRGARAIGVVDHGNLAARRHLRDPQVHSAGALGAVAERTGARVVGDSVQAARR